MFPMRASPHHTTLPGKPLPVEFSPGDIVEWIKIGNEHRLKTTTNVYYGVVVNMSGSDRIHIKVQMPCTSGYYWATRVTVPANLRKVTVDEIKALALNMQHEQRKNDPR